MFPYFLIFFVSMTRALDVTFCIFSSASVTLGHAYTRIHKYTQTHTHTHTWCHRLRPSVALARTLGVTLHGILSALSSSLEADKIWKPIFPQHEHVAVVQTIRCFRGWIVFGTHSIISNHDGHKPPRLTWNLNFKKGKRCVKTWKQRRRSRGAAHRCDAVPLPNVPGEYDREFYVERRVKTRCRRL